MNLLFSSQLWTQPPLYEVMHHFTFVLTELSICVTEYIKRRKKHSSFECSPFEARVSFKAEINVQIFASK